MKQYQGTFAPMPVLACFHKTVIFIGFFAIILVRSKIAGFFLTKTPNCQNAQIGANHPSSGRPSRARKIAFTDCGFAFPPEDFIT